MPELRKDYILDRYVIIATERAKRPDQFQSKPDESDGGKCYFCPGSESSTPPELYRVPDDDGNWKIRVFDNKFSAVARSGNANHQTHDDFFTFADAIGRHEVVVEAPGHDAQLANLTKEHMVDVLQTYCNRIREISRHPDVRYVLVFKNQGKEAGTSIAHTHTQIIGLNMVPSDILEKEKAASLAGTCQYCRIISKEISSDRRIMDTAGTVSFSPYASRFPMEAWIFPKRHVISICDLSEDELSEFAIQLLHILKKLAGINAPYNFFIHDGTKDMHMHLVIAPRLSKWAGFEMGSGIIINTVKPEDSAVFYRG